MPSSIMRSLYLILIATFISLTYSHRRVAPSTLRANKDDPIKYECRTTTYHKKQVNAAVKQACDLLNRNKKTMGFVRYPKSYTTSVADPRSSTGRSYRDNFLYPILPNGKIYRRWSFKFWRRSESHLIKMDAYCKHSAVVMRTVVNMDLGCRKFRCKKTIIYPACIAVHKPREPVFSDESDVEESDASSNEQSDDEQEYSSGEESDIE